MKVSKHKKPGNEPAITHKEILKRLYKQGYLCNPESVKEVKAFEQLAAEAFKEEGYARWPRRKYGKLTAR